jgi:hypothetical protein
VTALGVFVQWTTITDQDYDHTDVFVGSSSAYPPPSVNVFCTLGAGGGFVGLPNITDGDVQYLWIQHVDRSGNKSDYIGNSGFGSAGRSCTLKGIGLAQIASTLNIVADGTKQFSVGAVGTYAFLKKTSSGTASAGDVVSGPNLVYSDTSLTTGSNPSGQWQCMGRCPQNQATHWLRIS